MMEKHYSFWRRSGFLGASILTLLFLAFRFLLPKLKAEVVAVRPHKVGAEVWFLPDEAPFWLSLLVWSLALSLLCAIVWSLISCAVLIFQKKRKSSVAILLPVVGTYFLHVAALALFPSLLVVGGYMLVAVCLGLEFKPLWAFTVASVVLVTTGITLDLSQTHSLKNRFIPPESAKKGGISGVFFEQTFDGSNLLRFYPDGLVTEANVAHRGNIQSSWPSISKWFNRDHKPSGTFYNVNDRIWFSIPSTLPWNNNTHFYYVGSLKGDRLSLQCKYENEREVTEFNYTRLQVEE